MRGPDSSKLEDLREWLRKLHPAARIAVFGAVGTTAFALLVIAGLYIALMASTPELPMGADLYAMNRPAAITFLDSRGKIAGNRGAIVGDRLKISDMPNYLPAAFISMEDRRFYDHNGVDWRGILRALFADIRAGHTVQGGSTITQQVVKIIFLTPDRTLSRKLTQISGAWKLEHSLSKRDILELYLNRIYLGSGAYGVDGAAHVYFGKSARDVTPAEAAMLASLTTAPSVFSPRRDLPAAQVRARRVLAAMRATDAITDTQLANAEAHPASVTDRGAQDARNYFFDTAADEARRLTNGATGDLTIATTFDPAAEEAARRAIQAVMDKQGKNLHASQAALVSMTPRGEVRAIMGGRDYAESPFNRVTQAHRQPGSSFKPFVYLTALENGLTPWTVRADEPITIKGWSPTNYEGEQHGDVTLTVALAESINTVAVRLAQELGVQSVIATAKRLGIASPLEPNASLALGTSEVTPLELTGAYAHFASGGIRVEPYTVREVRGASGNILYHRDDSIPSPRVIREDDVASMNAMLMAVVEQGTGRGAALTGRDVAGKTGTTQDWHDAWFVGYSSNLVTGVWVGNDDATPMRKVTGGALPAQIWNRFMSIALRDVTPTPIPRASEPALQAEENTSDAMRYFVGRDREDYGTNDPNAEPDRAEERGQERTRRDNERHFNLFGWLFGPDPRDRDDDSPARPRSREDGVADDDRR